MKNHSKWIEFNNILMNTRNITFIRALIDEENNIYGLDIYFVHDKDMCIYYDDKKSLLKEFDKLKTLIYKAKL